MAKKPVMKSEKQILLEKEKLQIPFSEAEETLNAIRLGEADAIVVSSDTGEKVFSLTSIEEVFNQISSSHDLYHMLVEKASDGFWLLDEQFKTVFVNPAIEEMLGYSRDEMLGRSWYDFGDTAWVARAKELEKRIVGDIKETHEFLFVHKGGRKVQTRIATTSLYDKDGNFNGALSILSDQSKQKEASEALKIKDMLNSIAKSAGISITILNPDYTIAWYNDQYSKWFGTLEETKGRNCFEVFECRDSLCPECPSRVSFDKGDVAVAVRYGITTSIGSDRIIVLTSTPILNDSGKVIQVIEIAEDITEHKRIDEKLRESEEKYRTLFETMTLGVVYQSADGKIISANPASERILGLTLDQMQGRTSVDPLWRAIHKDGSNFPGEIHPSMIALNTGKEVHNTIMGIFNPKKNDYTWININAIPLFKDKAEKPFRIYTTFEDVTERTHAEENLKKSHRELEETLAKLKETQKQVLLQEKLRSLGQMTSGICHDINNSLSPIMGYTEMLRDDEELMKKHDKKLANIIKSTKNIARTIGRLKEFYKVKLEVEVLTEKDINKIINSTIELTSHKWKNMAESTGAVITIKREFQRDLPLTKVDESELTEALTNVILNACDAMKDGGTLTFRTYQKAENIAIEIKDTGMGMDEEALQRCMDPFYSTKGDQGTGLGLSMVFGVIDRHKGEIKIESERNKGTTIKLVLPVDKSIIENEKIDEIVKLLKPLKILSVEDDKVISEMLKLMLETKGNRVGSALNGKVGLELYNQAIEKGEPFDLVITDLGMAEMDGISLSKFIKELTPDIPIILLTGFGTLINKDDYKTVDCLLKKPIMMEDLFKGIAGLFGDK